MKLFRAGDNGTIRATFDTSDARLLASLATQLAGVIGERDELHDDPAIERLLPDGYRDNDEDAAEFRRFTETELADEKVRNALAMAEVLTPDGDFEGKVRISLDPIAAINWMRSLTDIRLTLAARLGIVDETSPIMVDDETRYTLAIYNWLGGVQHSLVKAVDK